MKNQYFGDFGDYQKFSLLKALRDVGGLKITVHWMKTADDLSSDGKKIKYLGAPEVWAGYDNDIFEFLKGHIHAKRRDLALYEKSTHAGGIRFINDHIESPESRASMLEDVRKDKASDLIFFDPDNGIEVASTNKKTLHKYALWSDMETAFNAGKSVLIYQHFSRQNREVFIKDKIVEMRRRFPTAHVQSIKVKHSVYFLICKKAKLRGIQKALAWYADVWKDIAVVN